MCAVQIEQVGRVRLRRPYAGMSLASAIIDETELSSCQGDVRRKGKSNKWTWSLE